MKIRFQILAITCLVTVTSFVKSMEDPKSCDERLRAALIEGHKSAFKSESCHSNVQSAFDKFIENGLLHDFAMTFYWEYCKLNPTDGADVKLIGSFLEKLNLSSELSSKDKKSEREIFIKYLRTELGISYYGSNVSNKKI